MDDHVYNKQELVGLKSYLFIQYGKDIAILKLWILDLNVINTKSPIIADEASPLNVAEG